MFSPNRIRAWLPALLLLLPPGAAAAAPDPVALVAASQNPGSVSFTGEQVTEIVEPGGTTRGATHSRVYRKGPILRVEYRSGQVMLDDGETSQIYLPRQRAVERGPSRAARAARQVQLAALRRSRIQVEVLKEDEVAGRPVWVVLVRDLRKPDQSRKLWIDQETKIQLRREEERADGRTARTYFTRIDYNAPPPPEKLTLDLPPGTQVIRQGEGRPIARPRAAQIAAAWGGLKLPRRLPAGYRLKRFYRHNLRSQGGVVAVYEAPGGKVISLFQGPASAAPLKLSSEMRQLRVVSARKGDAEMTLVGPLPEAEMQRMLNSIP